MHPKLVCADCEIGGGEDGAGQARCGEQSHQEALSRWRHTHNDSFVKSRSFSQIPAIPS